MATSLRRRAAAASPYLLAGLLGGAGLLHFVVPGPYADIVPSWLPGDADAYVYASGVAEMACAAAVALPRTRRLGGWATAGLFVAVFPANVTMALQTADGTTGAQVLAWGRLPLQVPLVAWAVWVGRRARG